MTKTPDRVSALDLPVADPLPPDTQAYFDLCQEKLGMVPNVLSAYAFSIDKLNVFTAMYNDMMLADSGLSKLEREMIWSRPSTVAGIVRLPMVRLCEPCPVIRHWARLW